MAARNFGRETCSAAARARALTSRSFGFFETSNMGDLEDAFAMAQYGIENA
jgi:hypothetical protein